MANVLPEEADIREEKSKGREFADENAHINAALQSVVYAPQSLPVPESGLTEKPQAAPPPGKGPNKNKNPDAQDDSASTDVDTDVTINVLDNDSDPDGDTLTISGTTDPANGTVTVNGDGTITYTPDPGFEGIDTFTYDVDDGNGGTATATVEVTVGTPPPPPPPPPAEPVNYIEALTFEDVNRWNYGDSLETPVTLYYTFLESTPSYYHPAATENRKFQSFTTEQRDFTYDMLDMIETYTNITFVETTDLSVAQITYGYADLGVRTAGWAYIPDGGDGVMDHPGDIWLNVKFGQDLSPGSFYGMALLHETGHAVGLAHPHDGTVLNDPTVDHRGYTVMSYNADADGGAEPVSLMLYDIAAIQYLYGANMTTNVGDTVYNLTDYFAVNYSIWDAGGQDLLDGSTQSVDLVLDLNAGAFSSIGLTNSLSIAFGATIENANGGSGNDTLIGNEFANILNGGSGNDSLYYDALDTLDGGSDNDTLVTIYESIIDISSSLLSSIENIDLSNALGDVVDVVLSDILSLSDNDDLYIVGDGALDVVNVTGGSNIGTVDVSGITYAHYTDGVADLYIENSLSINETVIV
ncbi:MAG: cadherin-like domain-containing protein [Alphaproteobacteria bacterium]|nr:cadherin-like domain-containing protein [Alphaproteobacteria bacterium]